MDIEKQRKRIIVITYWLMIAGLIYVALKYALPMLAPFAIGFCVSIILKPIVDALSKKHQNSRRIISIVVLLIFYAIVGFLLFLIGAKLFIFVRDFVYRIPGYYVYNIEPALADSFDRLALVLNRLDPTLLNAVNTMGDNFTQTLTGMVTNISGRMINYVTSFAGSLPTLLLSLIFTIMATVFFTTDFSRIKAFIFKQLSLRNQELLQVINVSFLGTIGKYLKAYAILMTITFIELSIGFWLLDIKYALQLALFIALLDILPVLGTGGVLVPWAIIDLLIGRIGLGIKIFLLYIFITVVRNVLEPKIVGQQIGLHPLITLFFMYVGLQLFGVIGLFGLPIMATIIKNLDDQGIINFIK
jgi:sporulation integral membrane protein YtvI